MKPNRASYQHTVWWTLRGQTEPFILLAAVILQRPKFNCEVCTVLGLFLKKWTTLATNRTLCLPPKYANYCVWSIAWMIRFWFESLHCLDDQILVWKFEMFGWSDFGLKVWNVWMIMQILVWKFALFGWSDFGLKVWNVWMIRFWFESLHCLNPYAQPSIEDNLLVLETRKFVNKRYSIHQSASDLQKTAFLIPGCGTWIPGYFAAQNVFCCCLVWIYHTREKVLW